MSYSNYIHAPTVVATATEFYTEIYHDPQLKNFRGWHCPRGREPQNPNFWNISYYHTKTIKLQNLTQWHSKARQWMHMVHHPTPTLNVDGPPYPHFFHMHNIYNPVAPSFTISVRLIDNSPYHHPCLRECYTYLSRICYLLMTSLVSFIHSSSINNKNTSSQ